MSMSATAATAAARAPESASATAATALVQARRRGRAQRASAAASASEAISRAAAAARSAIDPAGSGSAGAASSGAASLPPPAPPIRASVRSPSFMEVGAAIVSTIAATIRDLIKELFELIASFFASEPFTEEDASRNVTAEFESFTSRYTKVVHPAKVHVAIKITAMGAPSFHKKQVVTIDAADQGDARFLPVIASMKTEAMQYLAGKKVVKIDTILLIANECPPAAAGAPRGAAARPVGELSPQELRQLGNLTNIYKVKRTMLPGETTGKEDHYSMSNAVARRLIENEPLLAAS